MASVDRTTLLRASSMTSPRMSMKREVTPPTMSDPTLLHIHDRLNHLDARVLELRSTVLTKDAYVDRRNREDEFIRREFNNQRELAERIDVNVVVTRADVNQLKADLSHLKAEIIQLRTHVMQLGSKEAFLHHDVSQVKKDINQLQVDVQQLQTDLCATRTDLSQIQAVVSQLRIDLMTLQRETTHHFGEVFSRFSLMEARMKLAERIRFNSLAQTVHAPITPVPRVEEDGRMLWPEYFPRTVWKFWCLKKRNRLERLVELADFYRLEGYQYWSRMPTTLSSRFTDDVGYLSDSSDASDLPSDLTRAEAARQFPEACHQALAATLGLVYYQIRNEIGELTTHSHVISSGQKRMQEEVSSITSSSKPKPTKLIRPLPRAGISPTRLHRINTGPSLDSKSWVSEGLDKLGWNANSQISEETMSKLKGLVSDEVGARLLKALEHGHIKLRLSPTESAANISVRTRGSAAGDAAGAAEQDDSASMRTVPTEVITPLSANNEQWAPDTRSESSGATSP